MQPTAKIPISFTHHFDTACRYQRQGNKEKADEYFKKAAAACPEAWIGLAGGFSAENQTEEAVERLIEAMEATEKPLLKSVIANNIGTLLSDKGHSAAAEKYFRASYSYHKNPDSLANLALIAKANGRIDQAEYYIDKSLRMNPRNHQAWFTRSLLSLLKGDLIKGFIEYEARFRSKTTELEKLPVMRPEWNGERLQGKTILLYSEQGAGDTIQLLRYAPLLKERGAKVLIAPQIGLGSVCERMDCFDGIHEDILERISKGNVPAYDYQIPMFSLPRVFRTELTTIPKPVPFHTNKLKLLDNGKLNVGIVWAGSSAHQHDRFRSTSFTEWSRLFDFPVNWFSLQKGNRAVEAFSADVEIDHRIQNCKTFADSADLIASLDLVIGVDTSVIHLAGTLGVPTWMLNAFSPDWRWLLKRDDSPWYPSLTMFRQVQPLDWRWPFDNVKRELSKLCYFKRNQN